MKGNYKDNKKAGDKCMKKLTSYGQFSRVMKV